ncbi:translation initiation factor IF-2 [Peptoclostridium litorale DSM 5388]|uniref:Translation initiation factor IF-2 n=1 Tax=Peptoclostridium litorale DSM 5388 TaxID=1121324 RepID=A0A069RLY7_PEPLI|nr:translation initiation factor IF-2 [Peptoclostridium litorale]KDR95207.1 translation initiation factor IF-2 [Peptoclostridium litorale DSM 5388]SIN73378.1 translation initiation factor IF-2 [Peptoclostridium litorale DSM 5388]
MSRTRVYKVAQELGLSSKELIEKLEELDINVTNHMSTIEADEAELIMEILGGEGKSGSSENNAGKENESDLEVIKFAGILTVSELAKLLGKTPAEIITSLIKKGIMATINQEVDIDTANEIAFECGCEIEVEAEEEEEIEGLEIEEDKEEDLVYRSPIVTVMGHVDHGKTTLLDSIRNTNVTEKEAGGITQHIGASVVNISGKKITFLDTPGHEAFTSMRARGAQVTDIAILIVAADDGIMPQTVEAINHAKAAQVPIIVAINKIDKPAANPDRVKQELSEHGLLVEDWGGDIISVPVSAKQNENIDTLLEMILLVAEMEELKANPNRKATGIVIEGELDKGRGPVATVVVQNGTLKVGDPVVVGSTYGKVRAMLDDKGKNVKKAGPATPVEILGLSDVPQAGDQFIVVGSDKIARSVSEKRKDKIRAAQMKASQKVSLDDLFQQMQEGAVKELNVIIKADVQGSAQAVKQAFEKLSDEEVAVKVIHGGVGAITESDVMLASASNAIIIGFNVRPVSGAKSLAERESVDVRTYRIIYDAIEDVKDAMTGMLEPEFVEEELGKAEVRNTFKVSGVGTIAGCYVTEGKMVRSAQIRLVRDNIIIHDGKLASLKRFKDDAKEVAKGYECGMSIENFNDIKEGDFIEAYTMKEVERKRK